MSHEQSSAMPFISVLLPVRGETDEFRACLESLARQTYPLDRFEVIVADASDGPLDRGTPPDGLTVQVVPNPERLMSRGLNLAAQAASGAYLAVVSAHSLMPADYLARVVEIAATTGADNVGGLVVKQGIGAWGRAIAAATSSPLAVGNAVQHHGAEAGPADSAFPGFIRRATFDAVGGFDPRLACNEDDAFNARLRAIGSRVWYDPSVQVVYRPRESPGAAFWQHFRYGRWKVAVARTGVPGYLRWRHLVPSATVVGAVALPVAALAAPAASVPFVALGLGYILATLLEARRMRRAHGAGPWRTAAVFPVVHAGYGLGFLRGLLDRGLPVEGARVSRAGRGRGAAGPEPPR